MSARHVAWSLLLSVLVTGCASLGPDYVRPVVPLPAGWKAPDRSDMWQPAQPADVQPRGPWWSGFADTQLDDLEARALAASPTLQAALARLEQAEAVRSQRAAAALPTVQAGVSESRTRISANRPLSNYNAANLSTIQNDIRPQLTVSYELDWLGRIRRDIESSTASAEQALADRDNVRLVLTAQVASSYFGLRQLDEEAAILATAIETQERVEALIGKRHGAGLASQADVSQQSALVSTSKAQLALLRGQRKQQENALAALLGANAADFHLPAGRLPETLPEIPPEVPSRLLERRPDVASAERAMAAANAQIGVARAAWFPSVMLAPGFAGFESRRWASLFDAPSLVWSLGLAASQTLFDGGRADASVRFAEAGYAATVAAYRQSVLTAVRETQDALDGLHELGEAGRNQALAVEGQRKALRVSQVRYREGLDSALNLAVAQQSLLAAERSDAQIRGGRFAQSVALIKALGGGWSHPAR